MRLGAKEVDVAYDWPWFWSWRKLGFRGVFEQVMKGENEDYGDEQN